MTDICQGMIDYLVTTTDVVTLVDSTIAGSTLGIYPDVLPQNAPRPAIVYQLIGASGQHHVGGASKLCRSVIQLDCYADTRLAANAVAEQLRLAMDGYRGAMGSETVHGCHEAARRYDYEVPTNKSDTGRYRYSSDWEVWHSETLPNLGST